LRFAAVRGLLLPQFSSYTANFVKS
jgi:hypothetical protein